MILYFLIHFIISKTYTKYVPPPSKPKIVDTKDIIQILSKTSWVTDIQKKEFFTLNEFQTFILKYLDSQSVQKVLSRCSFTNNYWNLFHFVTFSASISQLNRERSFLRKNLLIKVGKIGEKYVFKTAIVHGKVSIWAYRNLIAKNSNGSTYIYNTTWVPMSSQQLTQYYGYITEAAQSTLSSTTKDLIKNN